MVGTDPDGMGGIRAVVRGYLDAGLLQRFAGTYVSTHCNGNFLLKAIVAVKGWIEVAAQLRTLDAPLVHVQSSSRASFWRKTVVCLMARAAGRPYLFHLHSGEFAQFYQNELAPPRQRIVRSVLAKAALVIVLSDHWRETLLRICPEARV